jgi:hypothetical protein
MTAERGIVLVAFGRKYVDLAFQAAQSIVEVCPGVEIDLFTEAPVEAGPFARIHVLEQVWVRSKLDSMLQSRFNKTIYLDVDIRAVSDFTDVFDVLNRFDMAAAHDQNRNAFSSRTEYLNPFPNAFPQINSGILAFRKSPAVTAFLQSWKAAVQEHNIGKDQPSLRELVWNSDLRCAILPPEYNFWDIRSIDRLTPLQTAPRIIHSNVFVMKPPPPTGADALSHYLGRARASRVRQLIAADETLARRAGTKARLPSRGEKLMLPLLGLADLPDKLRWKMMLRRKAR